LKRASEILPGIYRQGQGRAADLSGLVFSYWEEAAGPRLARISRPVFLGRNGDLIVEVEGGEWLQGLEEVAGRIAVKLNGAAGKRVVERLRFRPAVPRKQPQRAPEAVPEPYADAGGLRDPQRRRLYLASKRAAEKREAG
jgi:hypothetical protein